MFSSSFLPLLGSSGFKHHRRSFAYSPESRSLPTAKRHRFVLTRLSVVPLVFLKVLKRSAAAAIETQAIMSSDGMEQIQLLKAKEDNYDGVTVTMDEPMDPEAFLAALRASLSEWKLKGKKGVWIKLPIECSNLVHPAVQEGFKYHHAESEYLMLVKWIPEDIPSTIPQNASHRVGVGAFVMNDKRQVLVVRESSGRFKGTGVWKFPTGVVSEGEDIATAVVREVLEETGVETELVEILAFRQSHKAFFTKSDLLFICMLQPKSSHIEKQDVEIEEATWMPIDEYAQQEFVQKNEQFKFIAQICVERSNQQASGFTSTAVKTGSGKTTYVYSAKK